jgi:hypothetical protein
MEQIITNSETNEARKMFSETLHFMLHALLPMAVWWLIPQNYTASS